MNSAPLFQSVVYSHLSCKSHQNIFLFHPLLHPNVIRDSMPISCQQWIAQDITVCPNRLYQLSMNVSLQVEDKKAVAGNITFQYELSSAGKFRYTIPTILTSDLSVLKCTVFIPSDVTSISLICNIQNKSMLAYEMTVYSDQCILTLESIQDVQISQRQSFSIKRPSFSHHHNLPWWSSFADHLYLIHVPSVPYDYSFHVRNQLLTKSNGGQYFSYLHASSLSSTNNNNNNDSHSSETCGRCMLTNSNNDNNKMVLQTQKDEECIRQLWNEAVIHAKSFSYESILIIRDDVVLHRHWFEQIQQLLMTNTHSIVLLGAMHTTEQAPKTTIKEPSYTSSSHSNHVFGALLRTPNAMQLSSTTHATVAYPNIMVLHRQHSTHYQSLRKSKYVNRIAGHALYWDYDKVYCDDQSYKNRDNHQTTLFLQYPLYRSTLVHVILTMTADSKNANIQTVIQSIQSQTYSHWRLHIVGMMDNKKRVIQSDKIVYHNSIKDVCGYPNISTTDWMTFQSSLNRSVATRLDHEIRAWMYSNGVAPIVGCEANLNNSKTCLQKLDPDPTTLFHRVSYFLPSLTKLDHHKLSWSLPAEVIVIPEIFTFKN